LLAFSNRNVRTVLSAAKGGAYFLRLSVLNLRFCFSQLSCMSDVLCAVFGSCEARRKHLRSSFVSDAACIVENLPRATEFREESWEEQGSCLPGLLFSLCAALENYQRCLRVPHAGCLLPVNEPSSLFCPQIFLEFTSATQEVRRHGSDFCAAAAADQLSHQTRTLRYPLSVASLRDTFERFRVLPNKNGKSGETRLLSL